jgi:hypothetical protein
MRAKRYSVEQKALAHVDEGLSHADRRGAVLSRGRVARGCDEFVVATSSLQRLTLRKRARDLRGMETRSVA